MSSALKRSHLPIVRICFHRGCFSSGITELTANKSISYLIAPTDYNYLQNSGKSTKSWSTENVWNMQKWWNETFARKSMFLYHAWRLTSSLKFACYGVTGEVFLENYKIFSAWSLVLLLAFWLVCHDRIQIAAGCVHDSDTTKICCS